MKLVIDAIPPSLNKLMRMHWAPRRRLKTDWRLLVCAAAREEGGEPLPLLMVDWEPMLVRIDIYYSNRRRRQDADNSQKLLLDALVEAGLLYDDSLDWCEVRVRGFVDKDRPRTEITLEVADLDALRMEVEGA